MVSLFITLFSLSSTAMVWENKNTWNEDWENKYRQWVQKNMNREIYKENGPLGEVKTDCADAVLASRIMFSYLHNLPFSISNPTGERIDSYPFVHNELDKWDHIQDEQKRVVKFIEYIGDSVGTDFLARHATYSVKPELITSGDTYVYKNGGTRHSYVIKEIGPNGNQHLFWSTTPKKVRKLSTSVGLPGSGFDSSPWGYRRFRWPEFMGASESEIYEELGRSQRQYVLADQYGYHKVLKKIRDLLKVEDEELEEMLKRLVSNSCSALEDRVEIVNLAISYQKEINRCMNREEFDNYSTPSRDQKLKDHILEIIEIWKEAYVSGSTAGVSIEFQRALNYLAGVGENRTIFSRRSDEDKVYLRKLCKVELPTDKLGTFDLYDFYSLNKKNKISHNPNDNIFRRWGLKEGRRERCRNY
jgi:hypothetical protein